MRHRNENVLLSIDRIVGRMEEAYNSAKQTVEMKN